MCVLVEHPLCLYQDYCGDAKPGRGEALLHPPPPRLLLLVVKGNVTHLGVTESEVSSPVKGQSAFSQLTTVWTCEETLRRQWCRTHKEQLRKGAVCFGVWAAVVMSPETSSVVPQMASFFFFFFSPPMFWLFDQDSKKKMLWVKIETDAQYLAVLFISLYM